MAVEQQPSCSRVAELVYVPGYWFAEDTQQTVKQEEVSRRSPFAGNLRSFMNECGQLVEVSNVGFAEDPVGPVSKPHAWLGMAEENVAVREFPDSKWDGGGRDHGRAFSEGERNWHGGYEAFGSHVGKQVGIAFAPVDDGSKYLHAVSAFAEASRLFYGDTFPSPRIEESHVNDVNLQASNKHDALTELLSAFRDGLEAICRELLRPERVYWEEPEEED